MNTTANSANGLALAVEAATILPSTEVTATTTKPRVLKDTRPAPHTPGVRVEGDFLIFTVDISKNAVKAMTPSSTGKQWNLKPKLSAYQFGKQVAHGVPLKFTLNVGCEYDPALFLK